MDRIKQNLSSVKKKISKSIENSDIVAKGKNIINQHKNNKKVWVAVGTICLVIVIFFIYIVYKYSQTNVRRVRFFKNVQATDSIIKPIPTTALFQHRMGKEYSLSMWFRIDNWYKSSVSEEKHILTFGHTNPVHGAPTIVLKSDINDMVITVKTTNGVDTLLLKTVPIKQWFKLTVVMKENSIQVYLNSKLVIYKLLSGTIPSENIEGITLFNGDKKIDGHFSNLTFYPQALSPSEVSNLYDIGDKPTKQSWLYKLINMFLSIGQYSYDNILKGSNSCN